MSPRLMTRCDGPLCVKALLPNENRRVVVGRGSVRRFCSPECQDSWGAAQMSPREAIRERKKWAVDLLGGCCQFCGYDRSMRALHFHHLDSRTKEETVSRLLAGANKAAILAEIAKCVLLCSNCHAEVHDGLIDISEVG